MVLNTTASAFRLQHTPQRTLHRKASASLRWGNASAAASGCPVVSDPEQVPEAGQLPDDGYRDLGVLIEFLFSDEPVDMSDQVSQGEGEGDKDYVLDGDHYVLKNQDSCTTAIRGKASHKKTLRCKTCPYTTNNELLMARHCDAHSAIIRAKADDPGKRFFRCQTCYQIFYEKRTLNRHLKDRSRGL